MSDAIEQFRDAIRSAGLIPPDMIEPGKFHRFPGEDKRNGNTAAWCKLFPDGIGGIYGDYSTGLSTDWHANRETPYTPAEREAFKRHVAEAKVQAEAERKAKQAEAASKASALWKAGQPAGADHPYLVRKRVSPVETLREIDAGAVAAILGYSPKQSGEVLTGRLLVAPVKVGDKLSTAELIDEAGRKSALYGGAKAGGYWAAQPLPEGDGDGLTLLIGEGVATVLSAKEASGHRSIAALSAGNLPAVAKAMRERYPRGALVILADLLKVTGEADPHAIEAARSVGGLLAIPDFGADRKPEQTDFNDMARARGAEATKAQIESANPAQIAIVEGWSAPEKLPELPEVPAFNFDVLPGPLRGFVHDIADRKQCPPEFPAVGAVVMAGAAIGCRLGIRPKQFDPWTVVPNLWGAIIGKSGIMKSPALADAITPLKRMQAKAFEEYEQSKAEYEIAERAEKIKAADAEKRARDAYVKDRTANLSAYLKPEAELVEPKPRRYIVNDSTPEALCETLKDNANGVLCERDELIGLLRSMDKEGAQEARALYLTAADGDKSFTVDRIMRGSGRHIEHLCVSIVGGIQPGVLAGYVRETQRAGPGDDGLLQRFGLMVYPDLGKYRHVDRPEDREARDTVHGLIERLCNLKPEDVGAEVDPYGGIPFLRFSKEAQALFVEWLDDLEGRIRSGEDHPAITSHLSKYRKNVPALALINHLCEGGIGPVSEAALGRALLFIELLEAHARRVYSYAARPDLDAAKTILAKLNSGKLPVEFTARHVYRAGWSGLTGPEETAAAIRVLVDYGYLRERTVTDTGGRHSTIYRAHPSTKAAV